MRLVWFRRVPFADMHVFDHWRNWFIHRLFALQVSNRLWFGFVICRDKPAAQTWPLEKYPQEPGFIRKTIQPKDPTNG